MSSLSDSPGAVGITTTQSVETSQQMDSASTAAQSECLNLSNLMYKRLPKNLRDLVYTYLCFEDRRIPIGPYYHFRMYEPYVGGEPVYSDTQYCPRNGDLQTELSDGKTRIDHDIYPEEDLILPGCYIFNPGYMGQEVALEILETYYQSNSFSVCNIEGGLDDLCLAIPIGPEVSEPCPVPLDHIRDLQLRMKYEHLTKKCDTEDNPDVALGNIAEHDSYLRGTVDSLGAFRNRLLTYPHEMNLEIVLMTNLKKVRGYDSARQHAKAYFANFLQSIRNMVYELLHHREHMTVRVTHQDDGLMAFPKNYTGLFNLTKDQWDYETSKQTSDCDWSNDFWISPIESGSLPECDQAKLGGYYIDTLDEFIVSRWGVDDILRETVSTKAVVEGPYWPVGRPIDPSFAAELH